MYSFPVSLSAFLKEMNERFMPLEMFEHAIKEHEIEWINYDVSLRLAAEKRGDEFVAAVVQSIPIMKHKRLQHGIQDAWQMYLVYKLGGNYPKTCEILESWDTLKGIPHVSTISFILSKNNTLPNPRVREFLSNPRYDAVVANCAAHFVMYKNMSPTILVCRGGKVAGKITKLQWSLVAFWMRVRARVHAWRTSHSLTISTPYVVNEPLEHLLVRNPIRIPHAAYALSTTIHRDTETFLELTYKFEKDSTLKLSKWIQHIAAQDTAYAHRALRKVWWSSSKCNMNWYFAFAHILLDAPVSHNRLLHCVLHHALSSPAQFSMKMNALFWKCMRSSKERPVVVAKLLYISSLRNVWLADGHHAFSDLLWTPAVQANIQHECVCKAIGFYLNDKQIIELGRLKSRDFIQKSLWESRRIQKFHVNIMKMYQTRKDNFMERVPALWWAKKRRIAKRAEALANSVPLRTFAIRASYRWHKLQKTPCPICMEEGHAMVPLHMDLRHAICKECRGMVQRGKNCCPMCRVSLSCTKPRRDSVDDFINGFGEYSYYGDEGSDGRDYEDHEDEYYDDDQMYHYD